MGLASVSSVSHQLLTLERKGYLRRDPNRPRAIEVVAPEWTPETFHAEALGSVDAGEGSEGRPAASYVPVLGRIAAGIPITAEEAVEDVFPSPARSSARASCSCSRWSATR